MFDAYTLHATNLKDLKRLNEAAIVTELQLGEVKVSYNIVSYDLV